MAHDLAVAVELCLGDAAKLLGGRDVARCSLVQVGCIWYVGPAWGWGKGRVSGEARTRTRTRTRARTRWRRREGSVAVYCTNFGTIVRGQRGGECGLITVTRNVEGGLGGALVEILCGTLHPATMHVRPVRWELLIDV